MKNAFLHRDLEKKVYMATPSDFCMLNAEGKVYKLKKALSGLKESLRGGLRDLNKLY